MATTLPNRSNSTSQEVYPLGDISPEAYRGLALHAAKELGWAIFDIDATGFKAYTNPYVAADNRLIHFSVNDDMASVRCENISAQLFDYGGGRIFQFIEKMQAMRPDFTEEELKSIYERREMLKVDTPTIAPEVTNRGFASFFLPREGYIITPLLVNISLLIFIIMRLSGVPFFAAGEEALIRWGANFGPDTLNGQPWRLITASFLSTGVLPLLVSMFALVYIGQILEPLLGSLRFTLAYLLGAIAAGLTSLWWNDAAATSGAFGAIFGLCGICLAVFSTELLPRGLRKSMFRNMCIFTLLCLFFLKQPSDYYVAVFGSLTYGVVFGYSTYRFLYI
ncbi:rhomboid family intramembrane serine protease [Pedobacter deserti]|uniref:rhomboid family intramembrane serine protease n=1 Tax=Pedobacter deserti TaxID=2817382 RepID=UPI00210C44F5|nr:rhomboid family intramembrane serine protease [Pedobacter sp. SYSU D00382]